MSSFVRESLHRKIREIMSEIFRMPLENIDLGISQENCEKWDSLAHLNFVMALEEEFDIANKVENLNKNMNWRFFDAIKILSKLEKFEQSYLLIPLHQYKVL